LAFKEQAAEKLKTQIMLQEQYDAYEEEKT
jgi:hypothetical protein